MPNKNFNNLVGEPKEPPKPKRIGVQESGTNFGRTAQDAAAGPHNKASARSICRGEASGEPMAGNVKELVKRKFPEDK